MEARGLPLSVSQTLVTASAAFTDIIGSIFLSMNANSRVLYESNKFVKVKYKAKIYITKTKLN